MKIFYPLVVLLFTTFRAFGTPFDDSAQNYFEKLQDVGEPVFYSSCKTNGGAALLVFGMGSSSGMLFEIRGGSVTNSAITVLKDGSLTLDIHETQGGVYTYVVMQNHLADLSRMPFAFTLPKALDRLLRLTPGKTCIDKPPRA
jgi:hypothetical protein